MGEQQNLTAGNVDELKAHLEEMQNNNADLRYQFYPQDAGDPHKEIMEKIDTLERLIKATFDGHVLIDGRFQKITP
ncbi:MAG: hypothetical protein ABIE47_02050 [Pseudomonadota bacterium]